jgi:hypothetical protein
MGGFPFYYINVFLVTIENYTKIWLFKISEFACHVFSEISIAFSFFKEVYRLQVIFLLSNVLRETINLEQERKNKTKIDFIVTVSCDSWQVLMRYSELLYLEHEKT